MQRSRECLISDAFRSSRPGADSVARWLRLPAWPIFADAARIATAPRIFVALWLVHSTVGAWALCTLAGDAGRDVFQIGFGFGPLVENIVQHGRYAVGRVGSDGLVFTAHRMPLIPLFLSGVASLSHSLLAAYLLKNLVFGAVLWASVYWYYVREADALGTSGAILLALAFPQLSRRILDVHTEEAYLISFIAALFIGLIVCRRGGLSHPQVCGLAALNALLALVKSAMAPLCVTFCVLYFLATRSARVFGIFAVALASVLLLWAGSNAVRSGRFTIGSSWDGWNFYKGNNEETLAVYPVRTLDVLSSDVYAALEQPIPDEWAFDDALWRKGFAFLRAHPRTALRAVGVKAREFFVEVRPDGFPSGHARRIEGTARRIGMVFMVGFRMLFLACLGYSGRFLLRPRRPEGAGMVICWLAVTLAYALPCLLAFAYERHVMAIVLPTALFAAWTRHELLGAH